MSSNRWFIFFTARISRLAVHFAKPLFNISNYCWHAICNEGRVIPCATDHERRHWQGISTFNFQLDGCHFLRQKNMTYKIQIPGAEIVPIRFTSKKMALAAACLAGLAFCGSANAAVQACSTPDYDISNRVTNSIDCTILSPLDGQVNDSVSPPASTYTVNVNNFFGFNTWNFDGKYENGSDSSSLFGFTGDGQSGTYTFTGSSIYSQLMLVFKDGNDTNLVGYLLNVASPSGSYATPFTNPPFNLSGNATSKDISHISVYFQSGDTGVPPTGNAPEPGTIAMLGLGLLSMGFISRRTKKKQS